MKKLILALLMAAPLASFAKIVTVEVCTFGESGTECRMVTYDDRGGPSQPVAESCRVPTGEATYAPCNEHAKVPKWWADLNKWFNDHGMYAPDTSWQDNGGPNTP